MAGTHLHTNTIILTAKINLKINAYGLRDRIIDTYRLISSNDDSTALYRSSNDAWISMVSVMAVTILV